MNWQPAVYAIKIGGSVGRKLVGGMTAGPFGIHNEIINGKVHITHLRTGYRLVEPLGSIYHAMRVCEELDALGQELWFQEDPGELALQIQGVVERVLNAGVEIS